MLKLRKFSLSDLKRVKEIDKASFPQPWSEPYLRKLFEKHSKVFLVAEISKKIVGYILGYAEKNGSGSLKTLAVDPNYRRQGIGTKLINSTLNNLRKDGVNQVFLHTRTKNETALKFYKRLGFETLKSVKNHFSNGDDAYLMRKEI